MEKVINWILGILSTIVGFIAVDSIQFRRSLPEKYVLKDDLIRVMAENRQEHGKIFDKLEEILKELGKKADR